MTKKPNSRANLDRAIERLFGNYEKSLETISFRNMQSWPPTVVKGDDWEMLYNDANFKHGVSRTIDEAVAWANELIASIARA